MRRRFYSPYPLVNEKPPIPSSSSSHLPPARKPTPTIPPSSTPSGSTYTKPLITSLQHAPDVPFSDLTTTTTTATSGPSGLEHHTARGARGRFAPVHPESSSSRTTRDLLSLTARSPPLGGNLLLDPKVEPNGKSPVEGKGKFKEKMLWVCDGCFKYLSTLGGYTSHTVRSLTIIPSSSTLVEWSRADFPLGHTGRAPARWIIRPVERSTKKEVIASGKSRGTRKRYASRCIALLYLQGRLRSELIQIWVGLFARSCIART